MSEPANGQILEGFSERVKVFLFRVPGHLGPTGQIPKVFSERVFGPAQVPLFRVSRFFIPGFSHAPAQGHFAHAPAQGQKPGIKKLSLGHQKVLNCQRFLSERVKVFHSGFSGFADF